MRTMRNAMQKAGFRPSPKARLDGMCNAIKKYLRMGKNDEAYTLRTKAIIFANKHKLSTPEELKFRGTTNGQS